MSTVRLGRLIIVDDETALLAVLSEKLTAQGYDVAAYSSAREALRALERESFDVLLTDLMMPEMDGVALLRAALESDPHLGGVIMTGQATVQTAVEALKVGAHDYVLKPFKTPTILPVLARAMETRRLRLENVQLRDTLAIYDLCRAIAYTTDQQTILNKVADGALQQCEADEASVMLATMDGAELCVGAVCGPDRESLLGERVSIERGIAGWVARIREPMTLEGEVHDTRFAPVRPRPEIRAAISMPMLVGGNLVGVLNVSATHPRRPFTLGQVKGLSILASAAAAAIESARLLVRLRESESRYRAIFENAVEGISQTTPEGAFRAVNPALARMLGYDTPADLMASVGNAGELYQDPADRDELRRRLEQSGSVQGFETCKVRRDGRRVWVSLNARAIRDTTGALLFDCTAEDINERKRAEEELRSAEKKYRSIFDNAPEGIFQHTQAGRFLTVNPTLVRMLGYAGPDDLLASVHDAGRQLFADPESHREYVRQLEERDVVQGFECQFSRKDGSKIWVSLSARAGRDGGGVSLFEGTVEDITDRKKLEEQFRQAQKMEAVGRLAGGVAHDFNNLLTVINGYSELMLNTLPTTDPNWASVAAIRDSGERAAALTSQLLAFSRKSIVEPRVLDLNEVVAQSERLLRRLIGEDVILATALAPNLNLVKADPTQVEQVIVNLAVNARDVMSQGGRLTIETRNTRLGVDDATSYPDLRPGEYVQLAVSDTGIGIPDEIKANIFEPFFTTKDVGRGTGLGLAMVYGAVRTHGGHISVYSEVGVGTTFKILLPATTETSAPRSGEMRLAPRGDETVLLVEDEDGVRKLARLGLETQGYTVIEANGGEAARRVIAAHAGPIHAVVTDVVMAGMSGREVAEIVRARYTDVKVLYMSGYTDDAVVRHGIVEATDAFLQKPFTPLSLARKLRTILDGT